METLETSDSIKIEGQQEQNRSETTDRLGTNIVKSLSAVGRHFKVSQPAVSKWKAKGMPREDDGSYNLTRIAAWRALTVAREAESLEKVESVDSEVLAEVKRELVRFRSLGEIYKLERGDVFASAQAKLLSLAEEILEGIKSKDLKKMHVRDKIKGIKDIVSSVTGLYQQERLERGESTENISIIVQQIKEAKKRQYEEEKKEFAEWVEDHRTKKISIPSDSPAIERMRTEGISFEGLIIQDVSNNSWEKKNQWKP